MASVTPSRVWDHGCPTAHSKWIVTGATVAAVVALGAGVTVGVGVGEVGSGASVRGGVVGGKDVVVADERMGAWVGRAARVAWPPQAGSTQAITNIRLGKPHG